MAASTGTRFGELAGLRWSDVDLEKGTMSVERLFSHGAWADLKTENARRTVPLAATVRDELKARYAELNGNVVRIGRDDRTVFRAPEGGPLDYKNFRDRVWAPLLERTGPDKEHPKRVAVRGTLHMLRHSYATALIQSGENAKTCRRSWAITPWHSQWTSTRTRGRSKSRVLGRPRLGFCCRVVAKR